MGSRAMRCWPLSLLQAAGLVRHDAPDDVRVGVFLGAQGRFLALVRKAAHAALGRCCSAAVAGGVVCEPHDESILNTGPGGALCGGPARSKISTRIMRPPQQGQAIGGLASVWGSALVATGDGDAVGVAGQIGQDGLGSGEGPLGVDHPLGAAQRGQAGGEGCAVGQAGEVAEEGQASLGVGGGELLQQHSPPPGTMQWTCGWWVSAEPQV